MGVTKVGLKLTVIEGGATIVRLTEIDWLSKVAVALPFAAEPPAVNVEFAVAPAERFTGVVMLPPEAVNVTGRPVKAAKSVTVPPLLSLLRSAVMVEV